MGLFSIKVNIKIVQCYSNNMLYAICPFPGQTLREHPYSNTLKIPKTESFSDKKVDVFCKFLLKI